MSAAPVVPISALEHHVYCPRQCALIHVDGLWFDNRYTVRGQAGHRRVDSGENRSERGRTVVRAVPLFSETLGLSGRADAVEVHSDGNVVPVEYKMGVRHGIAADIQLCAQAMCLEEMLDREIPTGFLWLSGTRRRTEVAIDARLRSRTLRVIDAVRYWMHQGRLPEAENDRRCTRCQFSDHCLPDLVANPERIERYLREEVFACGT